ncbi:MAG: exodeoxyribonuclease VII small subunit [Phycisphaerales bacterium]
MAKRNPPTEQHPDPTAPERLTYEQAMEEVEAIADRIESGEAGLDESVAAYERGMALIRRCRTLLEQAEQRVIELSAEPPARSAATDADAPDEDPDA